MCAVILLSHMASVSAQSLSGKVISVQDGDSFTLLTPERKQVKIRVAEIDAPERGQPYGNRARQELTRLIKDQHVTVETQVVDRYGRIVGKPIVGDKDITAEMVKIGAAWVYCTYSEDESLYKLERQAKANKHGVWGTSEYENIPPWEWRQDKRTASTETPDADPFKCGAKTYCREMASCDEAKFHLSKCGLTSLDGDGDGAPCEAMCR